MINIAIELNDLSLAQIVPRNLQTGKNIPALIKALDPEIQEVSRTIPYIALLSEIDILGDKVLDLLAWQFHADYYDLAATTEMKREHVKNALLLHMRKGTVWAIKEALRQLDIQAEVSPWWENDDEPYTFRLRAIVGGEFYRTAGREALTANIKRAVNEAKSARSLMIELKTEIPDAKDLPLYVGIAPALTGHMTIGLRRPDNPDALKLFAGVPLMLDGNMTVGIHRNTLLTSNIFFALTVSQDWGVVIGVEVSDMYELLARFEDRILSRIEQLEARFTLSEEKSTASAVAELKDRIEALEAIVIKKEDDDE